MDQKLGTRWTESQGDHDVGHDPAEQTVLMTREAISDAINSLAQGILAANEDVGSFALLGILTRGRPLADRIADRIEAALEVRPPVGSLATTLNMTNTSMV